MDMSLCINIMFLHYQLKWLKLHLVIRIRNHIISKFHWQWIINLSIMLHTYEFLHFYNQLSMELLNILNFRCNNLFPYNLYISYHKLVNYCWYYKYLVNYMNLRINMYPYFILTLIHKHKHQFINMFNHLNLVGILMVIMNYNHLYKLIYLWQ